MPSRPMSISISSGALSGWSWRHVGPRLSAPSAFDVDPTNPPHDTTHRHCIVGRNFGSYVTHETKHFIYFYLGQVAILLFKSG